MYLLKFSPIDKWLQNIKETVLAGINISGINYFKKCRVDHLRLFCLNNELIVCVSWHQ